MLMRVKDFSGITQIRDNESLFGDSGGDDFLLYGMTDRDKLDPQKKQFNFIATTSDVDHDDEIVAQGAFHEERGTYLRNPVLLANHQHRSASGLSTVVGFTMRLDTNKNPARGVGQIIDTQAGKDHGVAVFSGAQRGVSVGFRVRETDRQDGRLIITKALLLEISLVSVPANPNALVLNYVSGKLETHALTNVSDSSKKRDLEQMIEELRCEIEVMKCGAELPLAGTKSVPVNDVEFDATSEPKPSEVLAAFAGEISGL